MRVVRRENMYNFVKRPLNEYEFNQFDLSKLGIYRSRMSKDPNWSWAVDEQNKVFFTQLISTSGVDGEQKEGIYYFLLFYRNDPIFIKLSGNEVSDENNVHYAEASFINSDSFKKYSVRHLISVVSLAETVLCYDYYKGRRSFILREEINLKLFVTSYRKKYGL